MVIYSAVDVTDPFSSARERFYTLNLHKIEKTLCGFYDSVAGFSSRIMDSNS